MKLSSIVLILALTSVHGKDQVNLRGGKEAESKASPTNLLDAVDSKDIGELNGPVPNELGWVPYSYAKALSIGRVTGMMLMTWKSPCPNDDTAKNVAPEDARSFVAWRGGRGWGRGFGRFGHWGRGWGRRPHGWGRFLREDKEVHSKAETPQGETKEVEPEVPKHHANAAEGKWVWVSYANAMEGSLEGEWDDADMGEEDAARSFVAWRGGRRWCFGGCSGRGGRWGHGWGGGY